MATIEIDLPADLVQAAENAGLLTSEAIDAMLCRELRRLAAESQGLTSNRVPARELSAEIEPQDMGIEAGALRARPGLD